MRPNASHDEPPGETLRTLFETTLVSAGKFRCPREHPRFRDSGPIRSFVLAFPRTAGAVRFEGERPFFVSPLISPLYNEGQRYGRMGLNAEGDRSDWLAIHDRHSVIELVREFDPAVEDHPDRPLRIRFAPVASSLYARQRFLLAAIGSTNPPGPAAVEEEVMTIFRQALRSGYASRGNSPRSRRARGDRERFFRVRMVLHESYRRRLPLSTLAAGAGLSAVHLCRLFRRYQGTSVHQTIVALRLRDSLEGLRDPRADLEALAVEIGFSSHSHFTAAFRRAFGLTPSQARGRLSRRQISDWGERLLRDDLRRPAISSPPASS